MRLSTTKDDLLVIFVFWPLLLKLLIGTALQHAEALRGDGTYCRERDCCCLRVKCYWDAF